MNKIIKALFGGLLITLFDAIFGGLTCGGAFNFIYKIQPWMWKPLCATKPDCKFMAMLSLNNFIFGFIFTLVFIWIYKGLPGKNSLQKGVYFGLIVWIIGNLPGMMSTHLFSNIFPGVISYLSLTALIRALAGGVLASLVYRE